MNIDDYQPRQPAVVGLDGDLLRAFMGDDVPRIGAALQVCSADGDSVYAAVRRHLGGREVEAMLLERPDWVRPGCAVHTTDRDAHLPAPTPGISRLGDLYIAPGTVQGAASADFSTTPATAPTTPAATTIALRTRPLSFAELRGARPPLATHIAPLDQLSPLAAGGFNLILDASPDPDVFDRLCARVAENLPVDTHLWLSADGRLAPWATHQLQLDAAAPRLLTGLRVLSTWGAWLRDQGRDLLLCCELAPLVSQGFASPEEVARGVSIGQVIDHLGESLSSTHTGSITALVRLPLAASAAGIASIIETMSLGEVDAQIFVDEDARFDPYRSLSNADLSDDARQAQSRTLSALSRAAAAQDRLALWGEFGIEPDELEAIHAVDALRVRL